MLKQFVKKTENTGKIMAIMLNIHSLLNLPWYVNSMLIHMEDQMITINFTFHHKMERGLTRGYGAVLLRIVGIYILSKMVSVNIYHPIMKQNH